MPETNPYPPGSARAKLWERREADRREKEKPSPEDKGSVRPKGRARDRARAIDDIVEDAVRGRRENQSTDSNN